MINLKVTGSKPLIRMKKTWVGFTVILIQTYVFFNYIRKKYDTFQVILTISNMTRTNGISILSISLYYDI